MAIREEFISLLDKILLERDEIMLKIHLATMDAKQEFEEAENQLRSLKIKAAEIADESVETTDEIIKRTKIIAEELKEAYCRIAKRLAE